MKITILALLVLLTGCNAITAVKTVGVVKDLGCVVITEESRADIRAKQKVKTNVCGDEL